MGEVTLKNDCPRQEGRGSRNIENIAAQVEVHQQVQQAGGRVQSRVAVVTSLSI